LPEVRVAARIHGAVGAGIDGDGRKIDVRLRGRPGRRDGAVAVSVGCRKEYVGVAPTIYLGRVLSVMRDVETIAADPIGPGREHGGGRVRDDAVVLQRAQSHARRRIALDVEVVEQGSLQAAPVEGGKGGAAAATVDPAVVAAVDDRERPRL